MKKNANTTKKPYFDGRAYVWEKSRECAEKSFREYSRNLYNDLYVHYMPDKGDIDIFSHNIFPPIEWKIAILEKIPKHLDMNNTTRWIAEQLMSVPCLPIDKL